MSLPLAGRTIVVTRPRAQADGLMARIAAAGGEAVLFPLLEIEPLADTSALDRAADCLDAATLAVFISANAVAFSVPAILARRPWPQSLPVVALGQGTMRSLHAAGIARVLAPSGQSDSEAVLALPELAAPRITGGLVLLFKGEGGRDLLAEAIAGRGASVLPVPCYRRLPPSGDMRVLHDLFAGGRLDAIVVSSSEAMRHLVSRLIDEFGDSGRQLLARTLVVVPHPRIADAAGAFCEEVKLTSSGDDGIVEGLSTYNWRPRAQP